MGKLAHRMRTHIEASAKISEDQETENQIKPFDPGRPRREGRADNEQDRDDVED